MENVADQVYVESSFSGVNVAAVETSAGLVCIDAPSYPRQARDWVARLQRLSQQPVAYLVLSDGHGDRILKSRWFNAPLIAHEAAARALTDLDKRYPAEAIESLIARNPFGGRELVSGPVEPVTISFDEAMVIHPDGRRIEFLHRPGPRPDSIWIYLPEEKVLFMGDHLVGDTLPDLTQADLDAWLHALENWQGAVSEVNCIVPGRGPISDSQAVDTTAAFLTEVRALIQDHVAAGNPVEETAALAPEIVRRFNEDAFPAQWAAELTAAGLAHIFDTLQSQE